MKEVAYSENSSLVSMKNGITTELSPIDTHKRNVASVLQTRLMASPNVDKDLLSIFIDNFLTKLLKILRYFLATVIHLFSEISQKRNGKSEEE